jgi:hypothetical protein
VSGTSGRNDAIRDSVCQINMPSQSTNSATSHPVTAPPEAATVTTIPPEFARII